jgi:hypothetical protein
MRLESLLRDTLSSLFSPFVGNKKKKKVYNINYWCQAYKPFFSSSLMKRTSKLGLLFLISLSTLVKDQEPTQELYLGKLWIFSQIIKQAGKASNLQTV